MCDSSTERFQQEIYDLTGSEPLSDPTQDDGFGGFGADPPSTTQGSDNNDSSGNDTQENSG